ncbi:MAG: manganese efflux pump, partial [Spirochaetia bacterium]|nr:manganese efflux pump [Spirochaetia bacterium]
MDWNFVFFINCVLLGVGLAMDAFSVSIANCLVNPKMSRGEMTGMALSYGIFQFIMPMAGWFCVHTIVSIFEKFQPFIPWIAF